MQIIGLTRPSLPDRFIPIETIVVFILKKRNAPVYNFVWQAAAGRDICTGTFFLLTLRLVGQETVFKLPPLATPDR